MGALAAAASAAVSEIAPAMSETMKNITGATQGTQGNNTAPAGGGQKIPDLSGDSGMNPQTAQANPTEVQAAHHSENGGGESPQRKNIITSLVDARNEAHKMRSDFRDGMRQKIYSYFAGGLNNG